MTEGEKEAIERMTKVRDKNVHTFVDELTMVLNLIQKQQAELEKKDNIIRELEEIFYDYELCEYEITDCRYRKCEYIADTERPPCKDCIQQYFEKQVEKE